MASKGLEMPVSGSDKVEVPILGCRLSEKTEHLPIKKRRFIFTSSPPHNTASNQEVQLQLQPKPVASFPPSESSTVTDTCQNSSIDNKVHGEKFTKASDDICGPLTIKLEANSLNFPKETGLHISKVPSKDSSSSSSPNNSTQKSAVCDERLNWDLNTVMAWEESPESDHNIHTTPATCHQENSKGCKQEQESENTSNKLLPNLRSLTHTIPIQDSEEHKPNSNDIKINKLLFPVISNAPNVTVSNIKPTDAINIVKLEYPPCDISTCTMPAGIGLSLDYSLPLPLGFNREENVVGSVSNVNHVITSMQTTDNENLNLSLVTVSSQTTFEEDDKSKVKTVITQDDQTTIGSLLMIQSLPEGEIEKQPSAVSSVHEAQVPIKSEKSTSVTYNKEEVDNIDELSIGYDSQFEDGEVRESSIQTWEGSEGDNRENENDTTDKFGICGSNENNSQLESSQKGTDEISSVILPEKPDTSEQVSNSEPNETNREVSTKNETETESNQWKMNVSGSELLSDDYNLNNKIKFYKKEPSTSTRDVFINRGSRFRMQEYSSSNRDDSGVVRSFRRGNSNNTKYSPHVRNSNRGGAAWNHSPVRDREPTFSLDQNDDIIRPGGPYVSPRQSFRTRLIGNREEDDFRARLGLRPAGDTRFVGWGRSLRYNPRGGRYGGPANDELEYSNSFKRRCFSPTERRENHPCVRHHSESTSPPRSHTRSRSPRIRRPRSPDYRFETDGYNNLEFRNNNNSPPGWVKYKKRSTVFNRSPPPPIGERLTFYDSSRKTKQNEDYRSGNPGRFSDVHGSVNVMDHGYRHGRGGFVKRHEIGSRSMKHIEYDEEDGYGPIEGMEFHGRGNPKAYINGTDSRFRDLPRRPREERENW